MATATGPVGTRTEALSANDIGPTPTRSLVRVGPMCVPHAVARQEYRFRADRGETIAQAVARWPARPSDW